MATLQPVSPLSVWSKFLCIDIHEAVPYDVGGRHGVPVTTSTIWVILYCLSPHGLHRRARDPPLNFRLLLTTHYVPVSLIYIFPFPHHLRRRHERV